MTILSVIKFESCSVDMTESLVFKQEALLVSFFFFLCCKGSCVFILGPIVTFLRIEITFSSCVLKFLPLLLNAFLCDSSFFRKNVDILIIFSATQ